MIGIVLVFKLVLTSMPQQQILNLFILGQPVSGSQLQPFMKAIQDVCWITAACAAVAIPLALLVPKDFKINAPKPAVTVAAPATTTTSPSPAEATVKSEIQDKDKLSGDVVVVNRMPAIELEEITRRDDVPETS